MLQVKHPRPQSLTCSAMSLMSASEGLLVVRDGKRGCDDEELTVLRAAMGAAVLPAAPLVELGVLEPACVLRLDGRLVSALDDMVTRISRGKTHDEV